MQTARACSTRLLVGATTTGLVFLEAENFFRFFLSNANPLCKPCDRCSAGLGGTGASKLGFESEGLSVMLSSDAGLLLWLWEWLCPISRQRELHTESSDRDLPINRDTFPVLAASINVPHLLLCDGVLFKWNLIMKILCRCNQNDTKLLTFRTLYGDGDLRWCYFGRKTLCCYVGASFLVLNWRYWRASNRISRDDGLRDGVVVEKR